MRISDWSSDVCSSDLWPPRHRQLYRERAPEVQHAEHRGLCGRPAEPGGLSAQRRQSGRPLTMWDPDDLTRRCRTLHAAMAARRPPPAEPPKRDAPPTVLHLGDKPGPEKHTQ